MGPLAGLWGQFWVFEGPRPSENPKKYHLTQKTFLQKDVFFWPSLNPILAVGAFDPCRTVGHPKKCRFRHQLLWKQMSSQRYAQRKPIFLVCVWDFGASWAGPGPRLCLNPPPQIQKCSNSVVMRVLTKITF